MAELIRNDSVLPYKIKGNHRWVLMITFNMDDEALSTIENAPEDQPTPLMFSFGEHCMSAIIGCIDCEQPYEKYRDKPCESGPFPGTDHLRN